MKYPNINANPYKKFFINIITRDITIEDSILDLIDNSIDGYLRNKQPETHYLIDISIENNRFAIHDNCGGITVDDIKERVFRFGREDYPTIESIGLFGIGMKRSLFKLGKKIELSSDNGDQYYTISIDVDEWIKEDSGDWRFSFTTIERSKEKPFFLIEITDLSEDVHHEFNQNRFLNDLKEKIEKTYFRYISKNLSININGLSIEPTKYLIIDSDEFSPEKKMVTYNGIDIEIIAGFNRESDVYGWYIFCNNRLVLEKNTISLTGWGTEGVRRYHYPQDSNFVGYVFFHSEEPWKLPWTTTKQGIEPESKVYKYIKKEMIHIMKPFLSFLSDIYRKKDRDGNTVGKSILLGQETMNINKLTKSQIRLPTIPMGKKLTYIQYQKEQREIDQIKEHIGKKYLSAKAIGELTFEYYLKKEGLK